MESIANGFYFGLGLLGAALAGFLALVIVSCFWHAYGERITRGYRFINFWITRPDLREQRRKS